MTPFSRIFALRHWGMLIASLVVASTLTVATPASAGQSPFCRTLLAFHSHAPQNSQDWKSYRAFARTVLPTFKKLAATAPNSATRELMDQLVAQLTFDTQANSVNAFKGYWTSHLRHWEYDWQQFAAAELTCVKALY